MIKQILKYGFLVFIAFGFQIGLNYNITQIFLDERIVPEILPVPPVNICRVFYPFGEILPGGNITFQLHKKPPERVWWHAENDSLYTLYLTGVTDWTPLKYRAPNSPLAVYGKEWHQWIVINIPGNNVTAGDTLQAYSTAGDPDFDNVTDIYLYLVYKQPDQFFDNITTRDGWSVFQRNYRPYRFARRNKLGNPIAGTHYIAHSEGYRGVYDSLRDPKA